MLELLHNSLLFTHGSFLVLICCMGCLFGLLLYRPLFWTSCIAFICFLYFFRNPDRVQAQQDARTIVSPADGTVVDISFDAQGYAQKVSIFISLFDVRMLKACMKGMIESVVYRPRSAATIFLSRPHREYNDVIIKNAHRKIITMRQCGSVIALDSICCFVHAGNPVAMGDVLGMARLGSQVDLFLPEDVILHVSVGQRVIGGHTIIGTWKQ